MSTTIEPIKIEVTAYRCPLCMYTRMPISIPLNGISDSSDILEEMKQHARIPVGVKTIPLPKGLLYKERVKLEEGADETWLDRMVLDSHVNSKHEYSNNILMNLSSPTSFSRIDSIEFKIKARVGEIWILDEEERRKYETDLAIQMRDLRRLRSGLNIERYVGMTPELKTWLNRD